MRSGRRGISHGVACAANLNTAGRVANFARLWTFALGVSVGVLGCRGPSSQVVAEGSVAPQGGWTGGVREWIPATATAWLEVDVDGLRAAPELAEVLANEGSGLDSVSLAVSAAERLAFYWTEPDFSERVVVVLGPVPGEALLNELRSASNFTGAPFSVVAAGAHQAWKAQSSDGTIALVEPNLLLSGDLGAVIDRLATLPAPAPPGAGAVVRGALRIDPLHRALLRRSGTQGDTIAGLLEIVTDAELSAVLAPDPRLTIDLRIVPGSDPTVLAALLRVMLDEALANDGSGLALRPAAGVTVVDRTDGRVVRIDLIVPRSTLAQWLATAERMERSGDGVR